MRTITGLFCGVCFFSFLVSAGYAQEPAASAPALTNHQISSWVLSDDPRLAAWGALATVATNAQALVPDLVEMADRWSPFLNETPTIPIQLNSQRISSIKGTRWPLCSTH